MKNKTLLLLYATLFLTAIAEPAYASSDNLLFQESTSVLCLLNNKFCKDEINNQSINEKNRYVEGGIFNIIDDALNNHVADVNVRMFRYMVAKKSDNAEFVVNKAKRLNDEVLSIQITRDDLGKKLKAKIITPENYAFAMKQLEIEEKYNKKQAKEMAKIVRDDLKDVKLSNEFDKVTKTKEDRDKSDSSKSSGKGEKEDKSDSSKGSSEDKSEGNKGSTGNSGSSGGGGSGGGHGGGKSGGGHGGGKG